LTTKPITMALTKRAIISNMDKLILNIANDYEN